MKPRLQIQVVDVDDEGTPDIDAIGRLLAQDAGHGECGGWTWASATQVIGCACGDDLFRYVEIEEPAT